MSATKSLLPMLLVACFVRSAAASDAKSFFAYIKEIAEPGNPNAVAENGREGRQTCAGPLCLTFSLNGISNFTFPVSSIPTNFPVACGGDDRNYCNYPDLPLIETYDLNYYSRRPIPSGRCPDGYTKMPTFDCLNIAPALFETTCCVFMSGTVPNICLGAAVDAMWTLCNGSTYISSGAYAWQYDQVGSAFVLKQGPVMLAALTGGCVSRDLAEAEVDGNCNVQFFNLNDQYFVTDYQFGTLGCTGPSLVTVLGITGTPSLVYGLGRGTIIYHIDGDGFQVVLSDGYDFSCGGNTTNMMAVIPPGSAGSAPYVNCTAATYVSASDAICYICNPAGTQVYLCTTRAGVPILTGPTGALAGLLSNCAATAASIAPLVYIPYPIYPVFTGGNQQGSYGSSGGSYGGSSGGGSSSYGGSSGGGSGSYSG